MTDVSTTARKPSAVARAMAFESGIWRSLARWLLRRPAIPAGTEPFSYHKMPTPVIWLWIFASGTEIVVVDVILPWGGVVRLVVALLGLWGLAWMLGMLGALKVYPHLVEDDGLRVRNSFAFDLLVPWADIDVVNAQSHDLASSVRSVQVEETERGVVLAVGVSGRTNVLVRLREPMRVATTRGDHVVTAIRLWADDNRDLVARVRALVAAS